MSEVPSKPPAKPTHIGEDCGYLDPRDTRGGMGVVIVVWEEPPDVDVFFPSPDTWVEGTPDPSLDGGAYAEEPKALDKETLAEWLDEGWITSIDGFKKELKAAFKRNPIGVGAPAAVRARNRRRSESGARSTHGRMP